MKKVFLAMAVLAIVFAGCKKEEDNLAEKIIGKWMIAAMDGKAWNAFIMDGSFRDRSGHKRRQSHLNR